jgi:prevent-host-death family protein
MEVNIHEAKTQLSRLIEKVLAGEDVVIAKAGNPLVRLVRIDHGKPVLGAASGVFQLSEGWDKPLTDSEMAELFGQ